VSVSRSPGDDPCLACRGIGVAFAGIHALRSVDLQLRQGEILGLIGTNGAGKTTLVNVLSGYQKPSSGSVTLDGTTITTWSPERRATKGVVRTFQGGRLFPQLTVAENIEVAATGAGLNRREAVERTRKLLEIGDMSSRWSSAAGTLAHGEIRVVGILRALAVEPRFMLVDEPAAGSNETETQTLLALLNTIAHDHEVGLLVIEHDMTMIMRLCTRIQVLDHGETIALGSPEEVRSDTAVIDAYLGSSRTVGN
jgi:branched-chain amino acid transport system ATP-binding protein